MLSYADTSGSDLAAAGVTRMEAGILQYVICYVQSVCVGRDVFFKFSTLRRPSQAFTWREVWFHQE